MEKDTNQKSTRKSTFAVIGALILVVASACYIVYRFVSEKLHNEKWKYYDECGQDAN